MTVQRGWNFLQTPGPTNIPNRVLNAMHRPAVEFLGPEFMAFCHDLFTDLKTVFKTDGHPFVYAANGHGAWEAAICNTLSPGDKVLVPETGRFALSWVYMAEMLKIDCEVLPNDWRIAINPDAVGERLAADTSHEIKAVLLVHTDTASGITSDIAGVRAAMDKAGHPALLMVDTIASLMTTDYRMDEWGVDVTVAAGQKGLMLPPGLSFSAINDKARAIAKNNTGMPRSYWDWNDRLNEKEFYRAFCGTAPEHLLFGLRAAIDMLMEEGFNNVFARHARLAKAVHAAVDTWAGAGVIELCATNPSERSTAVTTILIDPAYNPLDVRNICRDRFNLALGNGLGEFGENSFRIGHMGDLNETMVFGTLGAVEAGLKLAGIPYTPGGVNAAIEALTAD
jgi:alanine-glyoxylate transaminase / serine-glyoxylate transaminase / serine-pyruvate transaminase